MRFKGGPWPRERTRGPEMERRKARERFAHAKDGMRLVEGDTKEKAQGSEADVGL